MFQCSHALTSIITEGRTCTLHLRRMTWKVLWDTIGKLVVRAFVWPDGNLLLSSEVIWVDKDQAPVFRLQLFLAFLQACGRGTCSSVISVQDFSFDVLKSNFMVVQKPGKLLFSHTKPFAAIQYDGHIRRSRDIFQPLLVKRDWGGHLASLRPTWSPIATGLECQGSPSYMTGCASWVLHLPGLVCNCWTCRKSP